QGAVLGGHRLVGQAEVGVDVRLGVAEPDLGPPEHRYVVGDDSGGHPLHDLRRRLERSDRLVGVPGQGERLCAAGPELGAGAVNMIAGKGDGLVGQVDDLAGGPAFVGAADNLPGIDPALVSGSPDWSAYRREFCHHRRASGSRWLATSASAMTADSWAATRHRLVWSLPAALCSRAAISALRRLISSAGGSA